MEHILVRYNKNISETDLDGMSCMDTVRLLSTERNLGLMVPRREAENSGDQENYSANSHLA